MVLLRSVLLTLILLLSTHLSQAGQITYLLQNAVEQINILWKRTDIDKVLKSDKLDEDQKRKIRLTQDVRLWAEDKLGLNIKKNYTSYVDLGRPYVTYVLTVAEAYSLQPYDWSYPFFGKMPYRGFFDKDEALKEEKEWKDKGYDTYVRGVSAYSTLGWLKDPLLSSMLRYADHDLVDTIIHESTHATLYISNSSDFNERMAVFVGQKGMEMYYIDKEGANSPTLNKIKDESHDEPLFSEFISNEIKDLKKWYTDNKDRITPEMKKKRIALVQTNYKTVLKPKLQTNRHDYFEKLELNNARLSLYGTYVQDLNDFEDLYQLSDKNIKVFIEKCKSLEKHKDPKQGLKDLVATLKNNKPNP